MLATAAVLGAAAGFPARAFGDELALPVLQWDAPAGCPSGTAVGEEVARLLGGSIPRRSELDVRATVEHGRLWSVTITTRISGQSGRRTIESGSCQEVADVTALIVALMIDPGAVAAHAQDARADLTKAAQPISQPSAIGFGASLYVEGSQGTLPGLDVGLGAGIFLAAAWWRTELRATYGLRRDQVARAPSPPGAYGQFNFTAAAWSGCLNLGTSALGWGPCGTAELGMVSAKGVGASEGFPAHTAWVALGAGGYLVFRLGSHLGIPLQIDVLAPLLRPEYVFEGVEGRVYQAPAVGLRARGGISWRF
jgi:hypothetical protein